MKKLLTRPIILGLRAVSVSVATAPGRLARFISRSEHRAGRAVKTGVAKQEAVAKAGVKNTKDYDLFLLSTTKQGVFALVLGVCTAVQDFATGCRTAAAQTVHGVGDFFRQLGSAVRSTFAYSTAVLVDLVRSTGRGFVHLGELFARPFVLTGKTALGSIGRKYESDAKEEALGEITVTSDTAAHRELTLLAGFAVVVVIVAAVVVATGGPGAVSVSNVSPGQILDKLTTFSPEGLVLLTAVGVGLLFGFWFWLSMLRDCWKRDFPTNVEKTKWKLVIGSLFVLGAALYFWNVYNHWNLRRFVSYHFASVMVSGVAILIGTATYGTLWYFNQRAAASVTAQGGYQVPNLELPTSTKNMLLQRASYGPELRPGSGKTDPFAPLPVEEQTFGTGTVTASPSPSPSPSALPRS